jgi:hypothetical protein
MAVDAAKAARACRVGGAGNSAGAACGAGAAAGGAGPAGAVRVLLTGAAARTRVLVKREQWSLTAAIKFSKYAS